MNHNLKKELYQLIKSDESIFDFIQQRALDGLWYWDLENPENGWMNPRFSEVLGYDPEEMPHLASSWQNIINQKDLKNVTSTGDERFVLAHNIPLVDQNLMISTVQDNTQRKLAEDEFKKYRDRHEKLVMERMRDIGEKNQKLDRSLKVFVGRELTIKNSQNKKRELERE